MKINRLKQEVYRLTYTKNTKQLKFQRPELTQGKDLRRKDNWTAIFSTLKLIDGFHQDRTSQDLLVKHGFKSLDRNSSFDDLLNNVRSLGSLHNSLESQINVLEQKPNINKNES